MERILTCMASCILQYMEPKLRKARLHSSRTIAAEASDPALTDGILNIPQFLSARAYEIEAMELAQRTLKNAAATRIFQSLPRSLRRRTASHDVKRIPKRLRARALREMSSTPPIPQKPKGRALFKLKMHRRMLRLAARIKRLHQVPVDVPDSFHELKRAIDAQKTRTLNNSVGAADHCAWNKLADRPQGVRYASRQREFVWGPAHVWHAKRFKMHKRWGFQVPWTNNQKCYRATSRAGRHGTVAHEASYMSSFIVEGLRECLIMLLALVTRYNSPPQWLTEGQRAYTGKLYWENQPIGVGTIVCQGSLLFHLHPGTFPEYFTEIVKWAGDNSAKVCDTRYAIGTLKVAGPTALHSLSQVLHVLASQKVTNLWRLCAGVADSDLPEGTLFGFFSHDPRCWKHAVKPPPLLLKSVPQEMENGFRGFEPEALQALFTEQGRTESYRDMLSVKRIDQVFSHGGEFEQTGFPLLLVKTAIEWLVIMPWHWVMPLWSKLVKVSHVAVGGARQMHQISFERGVPSFPHDYPFWPEGHRNNELVRVAGDLARLKLPESKRKKMPLEFGLDLHGADWFYLRRLRYGLPLDGEPSRFGDFTPSGERVVKSVEDLDLLITAQKEDLRKHKGHELSVALYRKNDPQHKGFVAGTSKSGPLPVAQVRVTLLRKGAISDYARIYNSQEAKLEHLVGFVTSGAFSQADGAPTGIGCVAADHLHLKRVFVRNVGCSGVWPAAMEKCI